MWAFFLFLLYLFIFLNLIFKNIFIFVNRSQSQEAKTPDDSLFQFLSRKYASKNPIMANGSACVEDNFKNGITNGAQWYELEG